MNRVFLEILNMSIIASWIVLAVLLLRILLKKAPKWIRIVLWGIVAFKLICPFSIESELSLIPRKEIISSSILDVNNDNIIDIPTVENPSVTPNNPTVENTSVTPNNPTVENTSVTPNNPTVENTSVTPNNPTVENTSVTPNNPTIDNPPVTPNNPTVDNPPIAPNNPTVENPSVTPNKPTVDAPETNNPIINNEQSSQTKNEIIKATIPVASKIWLIGIGVMLLYFAISYINLYNKVKTAVLLKDNVFQSENVSSPFILGIIKPKIYIPFGLGEKEINSVISHERAHLQRKDHFIKPFGFLLLTIHWFNPLVWVAFVFLCKDIEFACDEKAIKSMNDSEKADYAQALLSCSIKKRYVSACPVAFGESGVKGRILSVINYKKPSFWIIVASVLACVLVAVFLLTSPNNKDKTTEKLSSIVSEEASEENSIEQSENTSETPSEEQSEAISEESSEDAENVSKEYILSDDITAELKDGVLTIRGNGNMPTYADESAVPWKDNKQKINKAIIEDGITSISSFSFYNCNNLTSVTIPQTVNIIGKSAFFLCGKLEKIDIPQTVTAIGEGAFSNCQSLKAITIPNITTIENHTFSHCFSLKTIVIPSSVTSIGKYAFYACEGLESVTIPNTIKTLDEFVFSDCVSLKSVTIPNSVVTIGKEAFSYCSSIVEMIIPSSVKNVGENAFLQCSSMETVTIPKTVTAFGKEAFKNCSVLKEINYSGTKSDWESISKGSNWNYGIISCTVYCIDGNIPLAGGVVYPQLTISFKGFDNSELDFTDVENIDMPEFASGIQISSNQTVGNFKFIRISYDSDGNPYSSGVLYSCEALTANDVFSVRTSIRKEFSNRGVSYTNYWGDTFYAVIEYNKVGNLTLTPFAETERKNVNTEIYKVNENSLVPVNVTIDGTAEGIVSSLISKGALWEGIEINFFYIENGVAHIDFNQKYKEYLVSVNESMGIGCVVNSLFAFYGDKGVKRVVITVNDREVRNGNVLFHSKTGDNSIYALLYLFDVNSMSLYTYPVSFDGKAEGLISQLVKHSGWNGDIGINSFNINGNTAVIDMNTAFSDSIGGLMSEAMVDCVKETIRSYYNVKKVELTIDGVPFKSLYA